jgi:hypothetical protein
MVVELSSGEFLGVGGLFAGPVLTLLAGAGQRLDLLDLVVIKRWRGFFAALVGSGNWVCG